MKLIYSVHGEDIIQRDLMRFGIRAGNARPAFLAIAKDMMDAMESQFDTQGAHASGGWEPLKEATLKAKAKAGLDPRILHATLALRNSLTGTGGDNVLIASDESLTFGSQLFYAGFHQTGTVHMAQRRPLEFTEIEKRGFVKTLQRYIIEGDMEGALV